MEKTKKIVHKKVMDWVPLIEGKMMGELKAQIAECERREEKMHKSMEKDMRETQESMLMVKAGETRRAEWREYFCEEFDNLMNLVKEWRAKLESEKIDADFLDYEELQTFMETRLDERWEEWRQILTENKKKWIEIRQEFFDELEKIRVETCTYLTDVSADYETRIADRQKDLEALEKSMQTKDVELEKRNTELLSIRSEMEKREKKDREEVNRKEEKMAKEIAERDKIEKQLREEITELEEQARREAHALLQRAEDEEMERRERLKRFNAEVEEKRKQLEMEFEKKQQQYRVELFDREKTLETMRNELEMKTQDCELLRDECDNLEQKYQDIKNLLDETNSDFQTELSAFHKKISHQESDIHKKYQSKIDELQSEIKEIKISFDEERNYFSNCIEQQNKNFLMQSSVLEKSADERVRSVENIKNKIIDDYVKKVSELERDLEDYKRNHPMTDPQHDLLQRKEEAWRNEKRFLVDSFNELQASSKEKMESLQRKFTADLLTIKENANSQIDFWRSQHQDSSHESRSVVTQTLLSQQKYSEEDLRNVANLGEIPSEVFASKTREKNISGKSKVAEKKKDVPHYMAEYVNVEMEEDEMEEEEKRKEAASAKKDRTKTRGKDMRTHKARSQEIEPHEEKDMSKTGVQDSLSYSGHRKEKSPAKSHAHFARLSPTGKKGASKEAAKRVTDWSYSEDGRHRHSKNGDQFSRIHRPGDHLVKRGAVLGEHGNSRLQSLSNFFSSFASKIIPGKDKSSAEEMDDTQISRKTWPSELDYDYEDQQVSVNVEPEMGTQTDTDTDREVEGVTRRSTRKAASRAQLQKKTAVKRKTGAKKSVSPSKRPTTTSSGAESSAEESEQEPMQTRGARSRSTSARQAAPKKKTAKRTQAKAKTHQAHPAIEEEKGSARGTRSTKKGQSAASLTRTDSSVSVPHRRMKLRPRQHGRVLIHHPEAESSAVDKRKEAHKARRDALVRKHKLQNLEHFIASFMEAEKVANLERRAIERMEQRNHDKGEVSHDQKSPSTTSSSRSHPAARKSSRATTRSRTRNQETTQNATPTETNRHTRRAAHATSPPSSSRMATRRVPRATSRSSSVAKSATPSHRQAAKKSTASRKASHSPARHNTEDLFTPRRLSSTATKKASGKGKRASKRTTQTKKLQQSQKKRVSDAEEGSETQSSIGEEQSPQRASRRTMEVQKNPYGGVQRTDDRTSFGSTHLRSSSRSPQHHDTWKMVTNAPFSYGAITSSPKQGRGATKRHSVSPVSTRRQSAAHSRATSRTSKSALANDEEQQHMLKGLMGEKSSYDTASHRRTQSRGKRATARRTRNADNTNTQTLNILTRGRRQKHPIHPLDYEEIIAEHPVQHAVTKRRASPASSQANKKARRSHSSTISRAGAGRTNALGKRTSSKDSSDIIDVDAGTSQTMTGSNKIQRTSMGRFASTRGQSRASPANKSTNTRNKSPIGQRAISSTPSSRSTRRSTTEKSRGASKLHGQQNYSLDNENTISRGKTSNTSKTQASHKRSSTPIRGKSTTAKRSSINRGRTSSASASSRNARGTPSTRSLSQEKEHSLSESESDEEMSREMPSGKTRAGHRLASSSWFDSATQETSSRRKGMSTRRSTSRKTHAPSKDRTLSPRTSTKASMRASPQESAKTSPQTSARTSPKASVRASSRVSAKASKEDTPQRQGRPKAARRASTGGKAPTRKIEEPKKLKTVFSGSTTPYASASEREAYSSASEHEMEHAHERTPMRLRTRSHHRAGDAGTKKGATSKAATKSPSRSHTRQSHVSPSISDSERQPMRTRSTQRNIASSTRSKQRNIASSAKSTSNIASPTRSTTRNATHRYAHPASSAKITGSTEKNSRTSSSSAALNKVKKTSVKRTARHSPVRSQYSHKSTSEQMTPSKSNRMSTRSMDKGSQRQTRGQYSSDSSVRKPSLESRLPTRNKGRAASTSSKGRAAATRTSMATRAKTSPSTTRRTRTQPPETTTRASKATSAKRTSTAKTQSTKGRRTASLKGRSARRTTQTTAATPKTHKKATTSGRRRPVEQSPSSPQPSSASSLTASPTSSARRVTLKKPAYLVLNTLALSRGVLGDEIGKTTSTAKRRRSPSTKTSHAAKRTKPTHKRTTEISSPTRYGGEQPLDYAELNVHGFDHMAVTSDNEQAAVHSKDVLDAASACCTTKSIVSHLHDHGTHSSHLEGQGHKKHTHAHKNTHVSNLTHQKQGDHAYAGRFASMEKGKRAEKPSYDVEEVDEEESPTLKKKMMKKSYPDVQMNMEKNIHHSDFYDLGDKMDLKKIGEQIQMNDTLLNAPLVFPHDLTRKISHAVIPGSHATSSKGIMDKSMHGTLPKGVFTSTTTTTALGVLPPGAMRKDIGSSMTSNNLSNTGEEYSVTQTTHTVRKAKITSIFNN